MPPKRRVLFLCIGNSCRSPMAEGFARTYGSDVLEASSAGLAPATIVQPLTIKVMRDRNVAIDDLVPLDAAFVDLSRFDLIVNMTGYELPLPVHCPVLDWKVRDPIGASEKVYQQVRDEIESLVMQLVLRFRAA